MNYHTRKWVKPEDLNPNHSLFGGRLLQWIDEEAALYAIIQLENTKVVTKFISEINFVSSAKQGDIIEIGIEAIHFGSSSITLRCDVRNKMTHQTIITVERIVMVNLDAEGNPAPHGKTQIEFVKDRLNKSL
ncbi:acyl-CoA thioesterase [Chryseobacterium cucumeris]